MANIELWIAVGGLSISLPILWQVVEGLRRRVAKLERYRAQSLGFLERLAKANCDDVEMKKSLLRHIGHISDSKSD